MTNHPQHTIRSIKQKLAAVLAGLFMLPVLGFTQPVVEVGGILVEDTYWTKENIYIVTDNVRVLGGTRLHIGPGTLVKFNQGRGLSIEGGKLHIGGALNDTVRLLPNYPGSENWNWAGLTISSVNEPDMVIIEYGHFEGAVVAIRSSSGNNILIRNSRIHNNRNIGISLINSSNCLVEHNHITNNFLGMEIYANNQGNTSAFNLVRANRFRNQTTNVLLHNDNHGACPFNIFEDNLILGGINGLWLFNSSHGGSGHATVRRNIIINTGTANDGYGIYLSMDSTVISNNILWKNTTAVNFTQSKKSHFLNNSIYANKNGVSIRNNSSDLALIQNTIVCNMKDVIVFNSSPEMIISQNNIFGNMQDSAIVRNLTPDDILIADNYWGTTNDSILRRLFFDRNNDPLLGSLLYEPVLPVPNTVAPISPPMNLTSQIVGNAVRLAWKANPESDLLGYRVYWGDFKNYHFPNFTDLIFGTVYMFYGISINDPIALTAIDLAGLQGQAQIKGHESPFAFPVPIPYAGENVTVCENQEFFAITESTLPAQYDSIFWQTSGDGVFEEPGQLRPVYFPGQNDVENRQVTLTLFGRMNGQVYSDSFRLDIAALPEVYAGEDAIIPPDSLFVPESASASGYKQLLWTTTGDGNFSQPGSLNPAYNPGPQDISLGHVYLILQAHSEHCGVLADTLKLVIRESFAVSGRVWAGSQLLPENPVIAVMLNEEFGFPSRLLTFTDESGNFRFNNLFSGEYLFYAPADTIGLPGFLPSYHAAKTRWQNAYLHTIEGNTFEIDIRLKQVAIDLPMGNGSISGHFSLPDKMDTGLSTFCTPWFGAGNDAYCNEGLSNVSILLFSLSRQVIYRHTLTDARGNFHFGDLPYGTYILEAEIAGHESAVSQELLISPGNASLTGISMRIEPEKKISITMPENMAEFSALSVYPNPAKDHIIISSKDFHDDKALVLRIYDAAGSEMYNITVIPVARHVRINIATLRSGFYTGMIENETGNLYFRIIKY